MAIDRDKISDVLRQFEIDHDVATLRAEGKTIWPLLRWYAYRDLIHGVPPSAPKGAPSEEKRKRLLRDRAEAEQRIFTIPRLPGGGLFVTRVEDFNQYLGGFSTCSYLDAIYALAAEEFPCHRIEIDAGQSPPEPEGTRYFPARYLSSHPFVRARVSGAVTPVASWEVTDSIHRGLEDLLGQPFDSFPYENLVREYLGYCDFFERVLGWARPAVVFAVSPFDVRSTAMATVAKRLGIVSVTIQYGVKSTLLFRKWARMPDRGFDMLADVLWARDEGMAQLVRDWQCPAHQVEIGGHPWLDWISSPEAPLLPEKDRLLRQISNEKPTILITTQGNRIPKIVVEAMKALQSRATFLIRLHPVIVRLRSLNDWRVGDEEISLMTRRGALLGLESEGPVTESWLREEGIENVEIRDASTIPLPVLLSMADHHITHRSSTATEAAVFGVPTTFIDPIGLSYDPELVASGLFGHADSMESLLARISSTPKRDWSIESELPGEMIHKDLDTARRALRAIFERAQKRSGHRAENAVA
ncbi:MAG: hypothetical protein KDM63_04205 [Verrucomicrobiae bacterium]|nr:hypothetical protein [Verrucomicrobiae bacterium]MCB1086223.1 hypothetical protein [Verrucomicrobiae bacterium]MCB1092116.1 hypothetical protein [Verrucomicrobiae bacterium]